MEAHSLRQPGPPHTTAPARFGVVRVFDRRLLGDSLHRALRDPELGCNLFRGLPCLEQGVYGMSVYHPEHPPRLLPLDPKCPAGRRNIRSLRPRMATEFREDQRQSLEDSQARAAGTSGEPRRVRNTPEAIDRCG
jgi:hypothetical protein